MPFKATIKGVLTGQTVAIVTFGAKMIITCLLMISHLLPIKTLKSTYLEWQLLSISKKAENC